MIDSGIQATPDTADRNLQARPDTTDINVQTRPETADRNLQVRPNTKAVNSNTDLAIPPETKTMDTEEQVDSRAWIKSLYTDNPNWVALRIQPIRRKNGKDDPRYRLGDKGSLISVIGDKKRFNYDTIDWVATEAKIRNIHYDGESNSNDEVGAMRGEENRIRTLMRLEGKKRPGDELEYLDVKLKDRRLNDIHFASKSTSTSSGNGKSRIKLLWI
ncbi:unnamed protein product [Phytophthora lilii]|uniref:Unnamed protein product n=1 Tax=Phytophthora lilii TaxID=2077276 RepID=A0A9W6X144_9STRA|nr:unnamed protein product [Phytophthora lilii]